MALLFSTLNTTVPFLTVLVDSLNLNSVAITVTVVDAACALGT